MTRYRRLTAVLALALFGLSAPNAAHATARSQYKGDCGFDTFSQQNVTGQDVYTGTVYAAVLLYSRDHGNVVNATVTCEIRVNGVSAWSSGVHWGSGLVAFAAPATYTAGDADTVNLCTIVDFTSDDTPTATECGEATTTQFPPQETIDLISVLLDWVDAMEITYGDPVVCPVFQALAPGVAPLTIDPTGDVFIDGEMWWDCPPYDEPPPPPPSGVVPPLPDFEPFLPTGGGYNTGDAGFLLLTAPDTRDVTSVCAYATTAGTITVTGSTVTAGADSSTVHCTLKDTATGAVLYDHTAAAHFHDTVAANDGPVTVCTEGTGVWSDRTVTVGPYCRPGEPLS